MGLMMEGQVSISWRGVTDTLKQDHLLQNMNGKPFKQSRETHK